MAYAQGWDASAPDGAITPAADIDVEIQNLKVALGERLAEVIPEWADDLEEPKKLSIIVDVIANRAATPDFAGEMFFATDTQVLYVADATPEWKSTGGIVVEEGEEQPSATFYTCAYLATLNTIVNNDTWVKVGGWVEIDQYGSFYNGFNPLRFTPPAAGTYMISCGFVVAPSNSSVSMDVTKNGATPSGSAYVIQGGNTQGTIPLVRIMTIAAGDYINFWAKSVLGSSAYLYTPSTVTIQRLP